ncbi:MAG: histidine phosphatase family protein [Chloroflexota bacterium]
MSLKRVYIVRHGETDYNVQHRWQGQLDVPLNKVGKQQAKSLATYFALQPLDAIYASDLKRTMDTVRPLAKKRQLTIVPDKRLREIHLGMFQGLKRNEIHDAYPREAMRWDNDDTFVVPHGESRSQVQDRMLTIWQEVIQQIDKQHVMLVSHGGSMRLLMRRIFPDSLEQFHFANTSITVLDRDEQNQWHITALNTLPHLDD